MTMILGFDAFQADSAGGGSEFGGEAGQMPGFSLLGAGGKF